MSYLGIDIGTSGVKALLIDRAGKALGEATAKSVEPVRPHPGWSEQNPADWWDAVTQGARFAEQIASGGDGRGARHWPLAATCTARRCSAKTTKSCAPASCGTMAARPPNAPRWKRRTPVLRDIAGNIAMPGFTAPKIAWVRKHEPEIYGKIAKVLLPKAYVRLLLTGEYVEDMSDAAGTLWLDVGKRDWSDELLAAHRPQPLSHAAPRRRLRPLGHPQARTGTAAGA